MSNRVTRVAAATLYEIHATNQHGSRVWGRFFLTKDGCLTTFSPFGVYGHWWTHPGDEIRAFLIDCDEGYITGKLSNGETEYDGEETVKRVKLEILRLRRERRISAKLASHEYDLLEAHDDLANERQLYLWHEATKLHDHIDTVSELVARSDPFRLRTFMKVLWPAFVEALRTELAAEAMRADATLAEAAAGGAEVLTGKAPP